MLVTPTKFVRKPFAVDAVEVTSENIVDVAQWCGGEVRESEPKKPGQETQSFIKVPVKRPLNDRQTRAYPGDWILSAGTGFKVYTPKAFTSSFEEQTDRMFEVIEQMDERVKEEDELYCEGYTEPQVLEVMRPKFEGVGTEF